MPTPFAAEFADELSSQYLANLLNPIEEKEAEDVGAARREGAAAGLIGQAATGSRIAGAEAAAGKAENNAISGFNMDVANKKYSERMTDEGRAFQDTERQKTEAFQRSMAEMGYAFEASQNQGALNEAKRGQVLGAVSGVAGATLGGYLGGMGRSAMAAGAAGGVSRNLSDGSVDESGGGRYGYEMDPGTA